MTPPASGLKVGLFATCVNDLMFPETPRMVAQMLGRLGAEVVSSPKQTCCGQMFTNTGYVKQGLQTVEAYIDAFSGCDYVVGPSASCVGSVRDQHSWLTKDHPNLHQEAVELSAKTLDLTEFLIDVLNVDDVGASFPHSVTYHSSCHSLRITKLGDRPLRLLRAVKGLTLIDLPDADRCCGFGGTFSMKNPDVSIAMATSKAKAIANTGAQFVTAPDNACLLNIGGILHRQQARIRPIHLAAILSSKESA
ncbi:MAG: (Fe-S)-binding protein [Propionibacteriaceae bacterium]|jgi:L-lactate dehydrogenase complex protein LldE|nr:(Fe-S)-binding protein [Propionibacteriaceae bacterium]